MKIESYQTEPEKKKIPMKNVAWYWRVPYIFIVSQVNFISKVPNIIECLFKLLFCHLAKKTF